MNTESDLGREVRENVRGILAKYNGQHEAIAGVKVDLLRKIDQLINPEPDTFRIPTERCDARPYEALSQARLDRLAGGAL